MQRSCIESTWSLDLGSSEIDDFDAVTIGIYLNECHTNLRVISLSGNHLTDDGVLSLLIGMQFHSNLTELYLGNNDLGAGTAVEGIATILPCFKSLKVLGLGGVGMSDEGVTYICSSVS